MIEETAVDQFIDRLEQAVVRRGTPVVVGIDPHLPMLPENILPASSVGAGPDSECWDFRKLALALQSFCRGVLDVVAGLVPAVKFQMAFFEQIGPAGLAVLADLVQQAHRGGLLVILDGKRGDIGSTALAYAQGMLGAGPSSAWGGDALTVNPYLGDDALQPFVQTAQERRAGIFVLVKTSNPGGRLFQDLVAEGKPIYRHVAALVERLASQQLGKCGYGDIGGVVGATYREQLAELREAMPHTWFLVPGYGSQGAGAADVAPAFDPRGRGAVINNSRAIIFAYRRREYERFGPGRWQEAVEAAARDMIAELRADTPAGRIALE